MAAMIPATIKNTTSAAIPWVFSTLEHFSLTTIHFCLRLPFFVGAVALGEAAVAFEFKLDWGLG